jgi:hypothetical protein
VRLGARGVSWAAMSGPRTFSWLQSALGAGIINALINAPLGLVLVKPGARLALFGLPGVAADLTAMAFGISFGTALVVTLQTRGQVRRGRLSPPALSPRLRASLERWPSSLFRRAWNLGVISVLLFVPLPLLVLWATGVHDMDRLALTVFKGVFSFVAGGLVTPLVVVAATVPRPEV